MKDERARYCVEIKRGALFPLAASRVDDSPRLAALFLRFDADGSEVHTRDRCNTRLSCARHYVGVAHFSAVSTGGVLVRARDCEETLANFPFPRRENRPIGLTNARKSARQIRVSRAQR